MLAVDIRKRQLGPVEMMNRAFAGVTGLLNFGHPGLEASESQSESNLKQDCIISTVPHKKDNTYLFHIYASFSGFKFKSILKAYFSGTDRAPKSTCERY